MRHLDQRNVHACVSETHFKKYWSKYHFLNSKMRIFGGHQILFYKFFFSFSFWNNRDTNVLLVSIFENAWKKVINFQKWPKWHFWQLITFFWCVFKNTEQDNICVFIVFKAESQPKHEEKNFCGFFSSKTQNLLCWG